MLTRLFSRQKDGQIDISREVMGGIVNFMAIAYIIIVNPIILNANGAGFPIGPAITATILTIIVATSLASVIIKLPFVLAPGMGMNAIIGYSLILHDKLDVATALGVILLSSILLLILSVSRVRSLIIEAIPQCLQVALGVGIGGFLFLIGIKNAGIIVGHPDTLVGMGKVGIISLLTWGGFILTVILMIKKKYYACLLPIILITFLYLLIKPGHMPPHLVQLPDFSLFMHVNWRGALKLSLLPAILSLFVVNFFDATSTVIGLVSHLDVRSPQDKAHYLKRALLTDSLGGIVSGICGTAPAVIFIESATAIESGAKTGLASLITALLCVPFLFLAPLIAIIPSAATSPVMMVVGILMILHIRNITATNFEDKVAVAVTVIMMPLCFSIAAGAVFGIVTYTVLKLLLGKFAELPTSLIVVAMLCCTWFLQFIS